MLHDVITGFGQFIGDRAIGRRRVGFGAFALVKDFGLFAKSDGKIRRPRISPGQILIPIFLVPRSFLLLVAPVSRGDAPAIRCIWRVARVRYRTPAP